MRKGLAISEEGFIVLVISWKQKVNHTVTTAISPTTATHTFKKTERSTTSSPSALAFDTQHVKLEV